MKQSLLAFSLCMLSSLAIAQTPIVNSQGDDYTVLNDDTFKSVCGISQINDDTLDSLRNSTLGACRHYGGYTVTTVGGTGL